MSTLQDVLDQTTAMHKHLCPRQVLGARMGLYAGKLLGLELPQSDKRLYTFVETDGCFSDGVAVATNCWLGRRTMRLMDYGKVAATFVDIEAERALRLHPHPQARTVALSYVPNAHSRWHAQLEAYQIMADEELLSVREVSLNLSMKALLSRAGMRVNCEECGEEILNEREVHVGDRILCRSCFGDSYWQHSEILHEHLLETR
ncbi:MAG: FmdE family protein [Anaerolineae bacterium]